MFFWNTVYMYMPGPVIVPWIGDRLRADTISQHVTSHTGQLSLAILPRVGAMSANLGWEGNWRRTGHTSQTIMVSSPTGSTAYVREMSTPPTLLLKYGTPLPLPLALWTEQ